MKLNKKMIAINVLATMLITDAAMAIIVGDRPLPTPSKNMVTTEEENSSSTEIISNDTSSCVSDEENETALPMSLFTQLARSAGDKVEIQLKPDNKITVKIPPVINVCGSFRPKIIQNDVTKNVTVMIEAYDANEKLMTHKELENCLSSDKHKILVNGKLDYSKVPRNGYTESTSTFGYQFDKKADITKDVNVSYAFPKSYYTSDGYKPAYGIIENAPAVKGYKCMLAEKIAPTSTYINEGRKAWLEKISAACNSGDVDRIISVRKSVGNADALSDIMEKVIGEMDVAILKLSKPEAERIFSEMSKIETYLNGNKDAEESAVKNKINKYVALIKELDSKFLNPAIYRLETLMTKRETIDDPESEEIVAIDAEIKSLNQDIGMFSKRNPASFATAYAAMEKFALTDSAKVVQDVRLKSALYSSVYPGRQDKSRGKQLTFESAKKEQTQKMQSFDRTLNLWTDVYLVGQGNDYPIKRTEREIRNASDRSNSNFVKFQRNELSNENKYCSISMTGGIKNPVKCNHFRSGRERRWKNFEKQAKKEKRFIDEKKYSLGKMGERDSIYQREIASNSDEDDLYDTFGSYSYEFENAYKEIDQAYSPSSYAGYESALNNYDNMNGMMSLGQTPMMITQQQQYNPQQGYQFQMPQRQQVGQWPMLQ